MNDERVARRQAPKQVEGTNMSNQTPEDQMSSDAEAVVKPGKKAWTDPCLDKLGGMDIVENSGTVFSDGQGRQQS